MICIDIENAETIEELLKKEDRSYCKNNKTYGGVLREKRIEKLLTLSDVTEGICCIAYLSNVERNRTTRNNPQVISKICERLDINYDDLKRVCDNDYLIDSLKCVLYNNKKGLEDSIGDLNNNSIIGIEQMLTQCLYYLYSYDYVNFNILFKKIDDIKKTLSSFQLSILVYCAVFYYMRTSQYRKADEYLGHFSTAKIENNYLEMLIYEARYIVDCHLGYKNYYLSYEKIKEYYDKGYPMSHQFYLRLIYQTTLPADMAFENIKSMRQEIVAIYRDEYNYVYSYILIKIGEYKKAMDFIQSKKIVSLNFIGLFSYALLMYKNSGDVDIKAYKDALLKMLTNVTYTNDDNIHLAFIKLMQYELDDEKDTVVYNYLNQEMLVDCDKFQVKLYFDYSVNRYIDLSSKLYKYKESFKYLAKLRKEGR
ncbi:MAG: hypothetical protein WCR33_02995 [Bacilli bacterium]